MDRDLQIAGRARIAALVDALPPSCYERRVLEMRWGLGSWDRPHTVAEIRGIIPGDLVDVMSTLWWGVDFATASADPR
jgi:hypothetical protein